MKLLIMAMRYFNVKDLVYTKINFFSTKIYIFLKSLLVSFLFSIFA